MEQRLTGNVPLLAVGFLRILARVFAGAIHILYGWLAWLAKQLFWDTAEVEMLDRHARLWGLTRKAAAFATGTVDFTGTDTTIIPSGTLLTDDDGIQFETLAQVTITGGVASVIANASEPGNDGNIDAGTVLELVEPISGVLTAEAATGGFTGGQDGESDAELRIRIDERISTPPAGGTAYDFERWAKEVTGVANAWALATTPSAGYVTVVVKASGSNPEPSSALLTLVEDNISDQMPVTANLVVVGVSKVDIDFTIDITVAPGADQSDTEAAITANLESYFEDVSEPGVDVLISGIRNAISSTGVADYEITAIDKDTVSQPIDNIAINGFEYPVVNVITYT
jgi:uncharacterized phage protein gp47/JayE